MPDVSARLSLPYLLPSQAQKHVTHNDALEILDSLVQLIVEEFDVTDPPADPDEGQVWAIGATPTGDWTGQAGLLACATATGWRFIAPQPGWTAVDRTVPALRVWSGTAWVPLGPGALNQLEGVGIGTDYDASNALAVAAPASLFSHGGTGGHQVKVNKASIAETASLLFQTGWSGRAEMGTAGSDDFEIKVSADGTAWQTALRLDAVTGTVEVPEGMTVSGSIEGTAVQASANDATPTRLLKTGAGGLLSSWPTWATNLDAQTHNQMLTATSGSVGVPTASGNWAVLHMQMRDNEAVQLAVQDSGPAHIRTRSAGTWLAWRRLWDTGNTTVDGNGFIKQASPIVRLSNDGAEDPVEPVSAHFARNAPGRYTLTGVPPLAATGWQIEVPKDHNGNRLVFVTTTYNKSLRRLSVRTSTVAWDAATGLWCAGEPADIPAGRWVDLRFDGEMTPGEDASPENRG